MDKFINILFLVALVAAPSSAIAGLDLRGKLVFENEIDSHECRELVRGNDSIAWVNSPVETSIGIIFRVCEKSQALDDEPSSTGVVSGGVKDGWYLVGTEPDMQLLTLPSLGDFSNPRFCRALAAYWAVRPDSPSSIILADLRTRAVLAEVSVGLLELETDNMYHLAPAEWDQPCTSATFFHEGILQKTVLRAKSN